MTDELKMVNGFWSLESENLFMCAREGTEVDVVVIPSGRLEVQPACREDQAMVLSPTPF